MKLFESLNCCLCKSPFVAIANQPRSPRHLGCGKAMCHECFEAEKALDKEERKHQCAKRNCFHNPNFAYYLIDVLSEVTLFQSPIQTGHLLSKPLNKPSCTICHEEFSTNGTNLPYPLYCLHNICWGCFEMCRKPNQADTKEKYAFRLTCSLCKTDTVTNRESPIRYSFLNFLEELPEMTRQLEGMKDSAFRFCDECKHLDSIEKMYICTLDNKKICGGCAFENHRGRNHIVSHLFPKEALDLSNSMEEASVNEVAIYQDVFPKLHAKINNHLKDFQEALNWKAGMLRNKRTFDALQKSHNNCKRLKSEFGALCEEYLPSLRKCDTHLEGLIRELKQEPM